MPRARGSAGCGRRTTTRVDVAFGLSRLFTERRGSPMANVPTFLELLPLLLFALLAYAAIDGTAGESLRSAPDRVTPVSFTGKQWLRVDLLANEHKRSTQDEASVAISADGAVSLAWQSRRQQAGTYGVYARHVANSGERPSGNDAPRRHHQDQHGRLHELTVGRLQRRGRGSRRAKQDLVHPRTRHVLALVHVDREQEDRDSRNRLCDDLGHQRRERSVLPRQPLAKGQVLHAARDPLRHDAWLQARFAHGVDQHKYVHDARAVTLHITGLPRFLREPGLRRQRQGDDDVARRTSLQGQTMYFSFVQDFTTWSFASPAIDVKFVK